MNGARGIMLVVLALMTSLGCAGPTVRTDFDPDADFGTFRTYAFAGMTDVNQGGVLDNSLVRKRVERMVGQQLMNKGLREVGLSDNPDLLVHYWIGLKEKQEIRSTGPAVGMYGHRGVYGWGAGYSGVTTYEYTEGTLIVDLVTPGNKELVWRASTLGELADSKEKNLQMADEALAKAFKNYPPQRTAP
jgi:hypothetical protein